MRATIPHFSQKKQPLGKGKKFNWNIPFSLCSVCCAKNQFPHFRKLHLKMSAHLRWQGLSERENEKERNKDMAKVCAFPIARCVSLLYLVCCDFRCRTADPFVRPKIYVFQAFIRHESSLWKMANNYRSWFSVWNWIAARWQQLVTTTGDK